MPPFFQNIFPAIPAGERRRAWGKKKGSIELPILWSYQLKWCLRS